MQKRNPFIRFLAMLLGLALVINLLPAEALASNMTETSSIVSEDLVSANETVAEESTVTSEPYIMAEVTDERTETTKTFRMSDGSYTLAAYDQPVHYERADGSFEEIDNTLVEEAITSVYDLNHSQTRSAKENRAGNTRIRFQGKSLQDVRQEAVSGTKIQETLGTVSDMVSMEVAGEAVSWGYEGIGAGEVVWEDVQDEEDLSRDDRFLTVSTATTKGIYANAFPYTDLEYLVSPEGIKENIILKDKRAGNTWTLEADIGSLTAVQTSEKAVELRDETGEAKLIIAAPEMEDAQGKLSVDVTLSMTITSGIMRLTITADKEFLQKEDTVYPVTVDPYFYLIAGSEISISDTYLSAAMPNTNMRGNGYAAGSIIVGNESSTYGKTRGLLKLNTLPNLPAGSVITDAKLILKNYYSYSAGSMTMEVRRATGSWTQSDATWSNSSTLYSSVIEDYYIVPKNTSPSNLFNTWEITRLMKGWYEGTYTNYGVMLTAFDVENTGYCTKYYSSNCPSYTGMYPTFLIAFRNNIGLEDYWTYHSQSVNGGTGYVNDYSGSMVFTLPVAVTTGLNMPVGISFIYNSQLSNQYYRNNTKGSINGAGWMTSYGQRLDLVNTMPEYSDIADELMAEGFDYVWLDSDGTHHFFHEQDDGTYQDEDGLGLTLRGNQTYGSQTVNVIEDKNGNKTGFLTNGYLLYFENHLGQRITMGYSGANLSWIQDGAGRQITLGYSGNTITSITSPEGTVTFNYSGNNLYTVNFLDGTKIQLRYTTVTTGGKTYNLLTTVTGRDGVKMVYEYGSGSTTQQKCRVASVTECAEDNETGNSISFDYIRQNITRVLYNKPNATVSELYYFNNWGHTTGVIGDNGSISQSYNTTEGSSSKNKITQVNTGTRYVDNILDNSSCEEGANEWTTYDYSPTKATFTVDTTTAYLGYKSLKIVQSADDPEIVPCAWKREVPVSSNTDYTFSVYVKTEDIVPLYTGSGVSAHVEMYNSNNTCVEISSCQIKLEGDNDWQRVFVSFTTTSSVTKVSLNVSMENTTGTAWFDCFQLERSETVSPYNMITNGTADGSTGWNGMNLTAGECEYLGLLNVYGEIGKKKGFYQTLQVNKAGVAFQMQAVAEAVAAPYEGKSYCHFALDIDVFYADGTSDYFCTDYNPDVQDWQTITLTAAPKPGNENKVIKYINAYVLYYNQVNYACFDDIMVTVDETGTTYTYDSDGNLISSADNAKRQTTYTIDNATDMVKGVTDSTNTAYTYDYDTTYKKQLKSAKENSTGIGYEYTYGTDNNRGNVEKVQMGTVGSMTSGKYIETNTQYTDNGAYVKVESDQRGYNTTYEVNSTTGEVDYVTDPAGTITDYTYDQTTKQLTNVASGATSATYGYDSATKGNRLKSITSNGQTYSFTYDKWGNQETVKIGDTRTLSTNSYEEGNGNLIRSTYGNEDFVHYSYDSYDRITDKWANEGTDTVPYLKASYTYNKNGQLGKKQEFPYGNTYYNYDISGRLTDYLDVLGKISYGYDNQNRTNKITLTFHNQKFTTTFDYLSANRPGITYLPKGRVEYIYDTLQRESAHVIYPFSGAPMFYRSETEYEDMEGNRTTTQVSGYHNYQGWGATSKMAIAGYSSFNYTYDSRGNIIEIEETNGTQTRTKSYKYDALNQLVRENDEAQGKTFIYSYDNGGNILSKTEYDYTTAEELGTIVNTKTYAYTDTEWKDKLTSYNGHAITCDAIGNPLTYYNGMTFNWEQGRRLSGVTLADGGTVDYRYKADGSRYEKTVGTTKTTYFTDDTGTIYAMESGNESLVFMYDATGRREGFVHYIGTTSNRTYYYLYNAQGDVIGLLTDTLSLNVSYEYDAWGKLVAIGGAEAETIGRLNPFRYRGYVYDEETGFYLTGTRYYDPVIGRFINADAAIGQIGNVQGTNMFAYCFNNPVNMSDPTGNWPKLSTVFKVVAVAAAVVAVAAVCVATAGLATVAVAGGGTMLVATATTTTALGVAATAGKVALAATGAAAASEIAEQTYDNLPRNHTVYGLQDPITGKIEYVGRTTDPAKRAAAHKNNTARQHLEMVTLATGLNAIEARGVEQIQMLAHHTINTANKMNNQINGISPFNRKLGVYMEAGRGALSYLENQISNEILYWTGN